MKGRETETTNLQSARIPLSSAGPQIQHILDAFPFYVLLVDSGHKIVAANRKIIEDFNASAQELVGAYCPSVVHGCSDPIAECPLVVAAEKGEAVEREWFDPKMARWIRAAIFPTLFDTDEGKPIYLHFASDITDIKGTEERLSHSLEHHTALSDLLQRLQHCQTSAEILDALIDEVLSLSWLGMATTAVGFLAKDNRLEMMVQRNLAPGQLARCKWVEFGDCLCGKAAQTGRSFVCSSESAEHTVGYEGMDVHRHAVLPISHEGRVLGVITLYLKSGDDLSPFQLEFLNAATSAAGAALAAQFAREEVKKVREKSLAQVISYQEDERKHIARELHDQVCQSLSALLLEIQGHGLADESLKAVQRDCELRVRRLIDEVRRMAGELRPTILDDYGLEMALARHTQELSAKTGITIDFQYVSYPDRSRRLSAPVEVGLFRIATEALSNVVSHSSASRASLVILRQNSRLMLLVEDNGCGFDYTAVRKDLDRCMGLIGMEERIALMGGTLRVESMPGKGTTLRAEIPLEPSDPGA